MIKNCPRCSKMLIKDKNKPDYYYCFLCAMEGSYKELEEYTMMISAKKNMNAETSVDMI